MKLMLYLVCLNLYITLSLSFYRNLKGNLLSLLQLQRKSGNRSNLIKNVHVNNLQTKRQKPMGVKSPFQQWAKKNEFDVEAEFPYLGIEDDTKNHKPSNNMRIFGADAKIDSSKGTMAKEYHRMDSMDPVLNFMRRFRRVYDYSSTSSSSREIKNWKQEFREMWLQKKFEALNQTIPGGDSVNMLAARPWGVPCGDPNQHDMPWGSCMLSMECEPEFRIYRGDMFCGRTRFVCCAILLSTYDMYQGFDVSLTMSITDSDEKREKDRTSREKRKRKAIKDRKKRRKARESRKKKIRRNINKIIKEIKKILNKQYKNGTKQRRKRSKQLKKFITDLKKQYKKDRKSIKNLHEKEMITIDRGLRERLKQIEYINQDYMRNSTFRDIVVNGTITKHGARMLLDAYPELATMLASRRDQSERWQRHGTRRGRGDAATGQDDYLEYDIEYGYLYS